jgi:hypothetical protein
MPFVAPPAFWTNLSHDPDFKLLSVANITKNMSMPDGVETIGIQTRIAYEHLISTVKVLLGMGFPAISPSVWSAL